MDRVGGVPSLSWVQHLELVSLDADRNRAELRPRPGHADLAKFAVGRQLERLKAEFAAVTDRRLELVIVGPASASSPSSEPGKPTGNASIRRKVMDLPLVKDALDVFPDAMLIDAREEEK
ncbi:MAG: hypothetical protein AAF797_08840 [Planctomycetota bacterium]